MTSVEYRDLPSFPVLPLREETYEPNRIVTVPFKRRRSALAIDAASRHGRIAVIARQRDPENDDPARGDLYENGMLVEILGVERVERQVNATIRVLHPVQIVKTDFDAPYLQMFVADGAVTSSTIGGLLAGLTAPTKDWLPEALRDLYAYLSHQLHGEIGNWTGNTELTLQHRASLAISQWLEQRGVRMHFDVADNLHMPNQGRFSDILIRHIKGDIAIEVKKNQNLDALLEDVRKLKDYKRGGGSVRVGVLIFPAKYEIDTDLLRKFTDDRELILVACAAR